jgi:hypothetical protein
MASKPMLEKMLLQAAGLLDLTENTVKGCRVAVDLEQLPEMDEDLWRVLAHVSEARRTLRYLRQAVLRAIEAQPELWQDEEEDEAS